MAERAAWPGAGAVCGLDVLGFSLPDGGSFGVWLADAAAWTREAWTGHVVLSDLSSSLRNQASALALVQSLRTHQETPSSTYVLPFGNV